MAEGSTDLKPSSSWVAEMHQSPGKTLLIYFGFICIWTVGSLVTSWTTVLARGYQGQKDPQNRATAAKQRPNQEERLAAANRRASDSEERRSPSKERRGCR